MPKSKNWVLLANYADKTLIRNDIAFMFSRSLEMEYTPRSQHIEVWMNGEYQGVYQLVEHIRIDNDRVDIHEMEVTDTTPETISGGYMLEIDFRMSDEYCQGPASAWDPVCVAGVNTDREDTLCLDSNYGMAPFCLDEPETLLEPEWSAQREYIENYFANTEAALFGENFSDPDIGYAAYLDVESTINYYLINELFKNPDGATASAYLTKKRDDKLFFGPIWDFDLSLGNAGYGGIGATYGWLTRSGTWFARLFEDPAFEAKVKARWQELKAEGKFELIFMYAEARANWLQAPQRRNFNLWQIFYWEEWYTRVILGSYDLEVEEMIRWQRARYNWMDAQFSN
jgi:CotH protein.